MHISVSVRVTSTDLYFDIFKNNIFRYSFQAVNFNIIISRTRIVFSRVQRKYPEDVNTACSFSTLRTCLVASAQEFYFAEMAVICLSV
jgi:hypothetical protein